MNRAFLLFVASAMLVAVGFAQTPAASVNTDQTNIKGCLGGSDGNYTVLEDNTGHIFKITTSSVDLKSHLGHDVSVTGHKANGASADAAGNSFAVTELNMISEHCAGAAAAPAATIIAPAETTITPTEAAAAPAAAVPTPSEASSTPAVAATAPAATTVTPAETASTPAATPVAPAAAVVAPAETAVTPAVAAPAPAAPAATVSTPTETASAPAATAAPTKRPPARRKPATTASPAAVVAPLATESASSETNSASDAPTAAAPASTSDTDSTLAAATTKPTAPAKGGSLTLLIVVAVVIIVIGTLAPLFGRWRKRKLLERTGSPNLSFSNETPSDQDKREPPVVGKAA
jgi:hypothetical protein